jgi:hypothetical protein
MEPDHVDSIAASEDVSVVVADSAARISSDVLTSPLSNVEEVVDCICAQQTRTIDDSFTPPLATMGEITNLNSVEPSHRADDHAFVPLMVSISPKEEQGDEEMRELVQEEQHEPEDEEPSESSKEWGGCSGTSVGPSPFGQCLSVHDLAFTVNVMRGRAPNPTVSWGKRLLSRNIAVRLRKMDNYALLCITELSDSDVAAISTYQTAEMLYIIVAKNRPLTEIEKRYLAELRRLILTSRNGVKDGGTLTERINKKAQLIFTYCEQSIYLWVGRLLNVLDTFVLSDVTISSNEVLDKFVKEAHFLYPNTKGLEKTVCVAKILEVWRARLVLPMSWRSWAFTSQVASHIAAIPGIGEEEFMQVQSEGLSVHEAMYEYGRYWDAILQMEDETKRRVSAKTDISIMEVDPAPPPLERLPGDMDGLKILNHWSKHTPPTPRREFIVEDVHDGLGEALCEDALTETTAYVHPACSLALYLVEHGLLFGDMKIGLSNGTVCWFCYRYLDVLQDLTFRLGRPVTFSVSSFHRDIYSPDWLTAEQTFGNLIAGRAQPLQWLNQPLPMARVMFDTLSLEMSHLRDKILENPYWSDDSDTESSQGADRAEDTEADESCMAEELINEDVAETAAADKDKITDDKPNLVERKKARLHRPYKLRGRNEWSEHGLHYLAKQYIKDGHASSLVIVDPIRRTLFTEDPSDAYFPDVEESDTDDEWSDIDVEESAVDGEDGAVDAEESVMDAEESDMDVEESDMDVGESGADVEESDMEHREEYHDLEAQVSFFQPLS